MICLPYFSRSWILQEVVLARSVVFIWDDLQFPYKYLILFEDWLNDNLSLSAKPGHLLDFASAHRLITLRFFPESKFKELIVQSTIRTQTDPRDRVYSILGLVESGPRIQPNYQKTVLEVYRDATLQAINNQRDLEILCTVYHAPEEDMKPYDWPSWVPRWIERPLPPIGSSNRYFCAYKPDIFYEPVLLGDASTLQIEGQLLASVASVISLGPVDREERLQCQGSGA